MVHPGGLTWSRDGFKYLGIFLGNEDFVLKNFEGAIEKVKGRLAKWSFLVKKLSYRGRVLVINNLVASSLWHRLACIDPPAHVLSKIQSVLVDFFFGTVYTGSNKVFCFCLKMRVARGWSTFKVGQQPFACSLYKGFWMDL